MIGKIVERRLGRSRRMHPAFFAALLLMVSGCASGGIRSGAEEIAGPLDPLAVTAEVFVDTASGAFVLVDLDENMLRFMHGDETVWEAPVGTGTGLLLESDVGDWEFSTPRGVFEAKYKEELPVWYLPDWYFVENELPLPPQDHPSRRIEGQLGVAAVYLGEEIAIHGTNRPELLGQRVSHGCIRLENRYAQRLYHNVQMGTPIVIVGGEHLASEPPPPATRPTERQDQPEDPLGGVPTQQILDDLASHLQAGDETAAWVPLASRLITRGLKDDAIALRGLLALAGTAGSDALNWEFGTFLADAFTRGSWRAVVSLARIDEQSRARATAAIVDATMALYPGSALDERAPWPTRRLPNGILGPEGQAGWDALLAAERHYRDRVLAASLEGGE
ncbi:MAG: L,D-transpeptidase family protein [Gemmatimonadota bacterium]